MMTHNPYIVALLETQISGDVAKRVCRKLGRSNWVRVEMEGFSGGLWLLWDRNRIELSITKVHKQFMYILISPDTEDELALTIVYASPKPSIQAEVWRELEEVDSSLAWCVIRDFNAVLRSEERTPPGRFSEGFQDWVLRNCLVDLGFIGPKFIWNHGTNAEQRCSARLNRAPADVSWQQRFPESTVLHCAHSYSDHCPILLCTQPSRVGGIGERPFRMEAAWLIDKRFFELAVTTWKKDAPLQEAIRLYLEG